MEISIIRRSEPTPSRAGPGHDPTSLSQWIRQLEPTDAPERGDAGRELSMVSPDVRVATLEPSEAPTLLHLKSSRRSSPPGPTRAPSFVNMP